MSSRRRQFVVFLSLHALATAGAAAPPHTFKIAKDTASYDDEPAALLLPHAHPESADEVEHEAMGEYSKLPEWSSPEAHPEAYVMATERGTTKMLFRDVFAPRTKAGKGKETSAEVAHWVIGSSPANVPVPQQEEVALVEENQVTAEIIGPEVDVDGPCGNAIVETSRSSWLFLDEMESREDMYELYGSYDKFDKEIAATAEAETALMERDYERRPIQIACVGPRTTLASGTVCCTHGAIFSMEHGWEHALEETEEELEEEAAALEAEEAEIRLHEMPETADEVEHEALGRYSKMRTGKAPLEHPEAYEMQGIKGERIMFKDTFAPRDHAGHGVAHEAQVTRWVVGALPETERFEDVAMDVGQLAVEIIGPPVEAAGKCGGDYIHVHMTEGWQILDEQSSSYDMKEMYSAEYDTGALKPIDLSRDYKTRLIAVECVGERRVFEDGEICCIEGARLAVGDMSSIPPAPPPWNAPSNQHTLTISAHMFALLSSLLVMSCCASGIMLGCMYNSRNKSERRGGYGRQRLGQSECEEAEDGVRTKKAPNKANAATEQELANTDDKCCSPGGSAVGSEADAVHAAMGQALGSVNGRP